MMYWVHLNIPPPRNNMMRIVLFICAALLFASYYFGDRVQIPGIHKVTTTHDSYLLGVLETLFLACWLDKIWGASYYFGVINSMIRASYYFSCVVPLVDR